MSIADTLDLAQLAASGLLLPLVGMAYSMQRRVSRMEAQLEMLLLSLNRSGAKPHDR